MASSSKPGASKPPASKPRARGTRAGEGSEAGAAGSTGGGRAGGKPGRGRPKDEANARQRREEILRCATRHFAKEGFPNAELDAVAAELGCAKGTLYRYFETKRDLFGEAVDAVMVELRGRLRGDPSGDPLERLEAMVRGFLEYFDEFPEHRELLIQERAQFRDRRRASIAKYRAEYEKEWDGVYERLMAAGRVRRMPVRRPSVVLAELLYGALFRSEFAGRRVKLASRAEDVLDVFFRGILTPEEARKRRLGTGGVGSGVKRRGTNQRGRVRGGAERG